MYVPPVIVLLQPLRSMCQDRLNVQETHSCKCLWRIDRRGRRRRDGQSLRLLRKQRRETEAGSRSLGRTSASADRWRGPWAAWPCSRAAVFSRRPGLRLLAAVVPRVPACGASAHYTPRRSRGGSIPVLVVVLHAYLCMINSVLLLSVIFFVNGINCAYKFCKIIFYASMLSKQVHAH